MDDEDLIRPLAPRVSILEGWFNDWMAAWEPRAAEMAGQVNDSEAVSVHWSHLLRGIERALEVEGTVAHAAGLEELLQAFNVDAYWSYDRATERLRIRRVWLSRALSHTFDEDPLPDVTGYADLVFGLLARLDAPNEHRFATRCSAHIYLDGEPTPERRRRWEDIASFADAFRAGFSEDAALDDDVFGLTDLSDIALPRLSEALHDYVRRNLVGVEGLSLTTQAQPTQGFSRNSENHAAVAALVALREELAFLDGDVRRALSHDDSGAGDPGLSRAVTRVATIASEEVQLLHSIPARWHDSAFVWSEEDRPIVLSVLSGSIRARGTCRASGGLKDLPPGFDPFSGQTHDPDQFDASMAFDLDALGHLTISVLEPKRFPENHVRQGFEHCSETIRLPNLSRYIHAQVEAAVRLATVEVPAFQMDAQQRIIQKASTCEDINRLWPYSEGPMVVDF